MADKREDITIDELVRSTQSTLDDYIKSWKQYCASMQAEVSESLMSESKDENKSLEDYIAEIQEKRNKQGDMYYSLANELLDGVFALEDGMKMYIDFLAVRNCILNIMVPNGLSLEFVLTETDKGVKLEVASSPYLYDKRFDDLMAKTEDKLKESEAGKIVYQILNERHKQIMKKTNILGMWPELAEKIDASGFEGESEKLHEHKKEKSFIDELEILIEKNKKELDETSGVRLIKKGLLKKQISMTQDELYNHKEKYKEMIENYNRELSLIESDLRMVVDKIADIDGKLKDLGWCDIKRTVENNEKIIFKCKFSGIYNAYIISTKNTGIISEFALRYIEKILYDHLKPKEGKMLYSDAVRLIQNEAESKYGYFLSAQCISSIFNALQKRDLVEQFDAGHGRERKHYIRVKRDVYNE